MLGLGNTLSGGIVPAAVAIFDEKAINGMDAGWKYLTSTSNLPDVFTGASQQTWTLVMRFYHNSSGNKGFFHFVFAGGESIYMQNFGQTL